MSHLPSILYLGTFGCHLMLFIFSRAAFHQMINFFNRCYYDYILEDI